MAEIVAQALRGLGDEQAQLDGTGFSQLFARLVSGPLSELIQLHNLYAAREDGFLHVALSEDDL